MLLHEIAKPSYHDIIMMNIVYEKIQLYSLHVSHLIQLSFKNQQHLCHMFAFAYRFIQLQNIVVRFSRATLDVDGLLGVGQLEDQPLGAEAQVQRDVPRDGGLRGGHKEVERGLSRKPGAPLEHAAHDEQHYPWDSHKESDRYEYITQAHTIKGWMGTYLTE